MRFHDVRRPSLLTLFLLGLVAWSPANAFADKTATGDAIGDTFGSGSERIDITSFSAVTAGDDLVLRLGFASPVSAPNSGQPNALSGFIDLDTDRSAGTGSRPFVDFLTDFASGLGNELHVPLVTYSDGTVDVVDDASDTAVARVPMSLSASSLEVRVPSSLVGGDVHTAAVVGTAAEATDAVPNGGFLTSAGTGEGGILLNGDRFRVEVSWKDFEGTTGSAELGVRSDDSAVIYFFDANNWELLVKVLDACGLNNHYWVFAAATTNVEYTLTITDTSTGNVQVYSNPLGTAAAAVNDTGAFATCP